jgi:hypothetical protein
MAIGVVLVTKAGEVRESRVTDTEPITLARKCGFKNAGGFSKHASWPAAGEPDLTIELWGRTKGRAGSENKYDFPPPVDSVLFFGICCLVGRRQHNATIEDLHAETWARTYEKLFGGFEDLTQEEDPSSDELDDVAAEMKTECGGYLRDGFVTDGEEDDNSDSGSDGADDEGSAISLSGDSSDGDEDEDDVPLESDSEEGGELEESEYDYSEDDDGKPEIECA